jgi:hypothetical protein
VTIGRDSRWLNAESDRPLVHKRRFSAGIT